MFKIATKLAPRSQMRLSNTPRMPLNLRSAPRRRTGERGDKRTGGVSVDSQAQTILLVASVPLADENWRPLGEGELLMVRQGEIYGHGGPISS